MRKMARKVLEFYHQRTRYTNSISPSIWVLKVSPSTSSVTLAWMFWASKSWGERKIMNRNRKRFNLYFTIRCIRNYLRNKININNLAMSNDYNRIQKNRKPTNCDWINTKWKKMKSVAIELVQPSPVASI